MPAMKRTISLVALLLLSACARVGSDTLRAPLPAPLPLSAPVEPARIPLKDYPATLQIRVADELKALPETSVVAGFIEDYGQLRRAVCAAETWKQPTCRRIRVADKETD